MAVASSPLRYVDEERSWVRCTSSTVHMPDENPMKMSRSLVKKPTLQERTGRRPLSLDSVQHRDLAPPFLANQRTRAKYHEAFAARR
jgi:hypothetical protein